MERVHIKRYPYGRWTLTRELQPPKFRSDCDYCGKVDSGKFTYWVEPDSVSNRDSEVKGLFCSKQCMALYHDHWDA